MPRPDVTVDSDGINLLFMTENERDSFRLFGKYDDVSSASAAFNNLTALTIAENEWQGLASPLRKTKYGFTGPAA